jgi:hypothetical protein
VRSGVVSQRPGSGWSVSLGEQVAASARVLDARTGRADQDSGDREPRGFYVARDVGGLEGIAIEFDRLTEPGGQVADLWQRHKAG